MVKTGISRRRFMKTSAVGALTTFAGMKAAGREIDRRKIGVSRTSLRRLHAIPTTCEQCPAGCGIIAYLNGDRLVQVLGNPEHPNNRGGICAKGIAGINLVNDPERLLFPMKRIGPRGSGRWTRITWDEAYTVLDSRITRLIESGRTDELVLDMGEQDTLLEQFATALGPSNLVDRVKLKNLNRSAAYTSILGSPSFIEDVGRSRIILNFGANPYANHDHFIGFARRLILAKVENGAKLFTFDVRMSETAAKSDAWYPVKPGTDAVVALAMAKVIAERGLAKQNFMESSTNIKLRTLKQHLSPYTPDFAERESGVRAGDIVRLAADFATKKPAIAIAGGGVSDHANGCQNARCVALLNLVVGNFEQEGGLYFPRWFFTPQSSVSEKQGKQSLKGFSETVTTDADIDTLFAFLSNPAYTEPDCEAVRRYLSDEKNIPFIVVMDTHMTETAVLADMVLPAATHLEGWGLKNAPSLDNAAIINLRQPVVSLMSSAQVLRSSEFDVGKLLDPRFRPLGEAREVGAVCIELARRIGGTIARSLPYRDTYEFVTRIAFSLPGVKSQGGLPALMSRSFLTAQPEVDEKKPTRKTEAYTNSFEQPGLAPLPEYQPLEEHKKRKKGEFILTTFKTNLWAGGNANSKWLREILHENRLWVNKRAADELGINNGDRVRLVSRVGSLETRVLTTNRIHPDSVALAEGLGHWATGNVARAKNFKSKDGDTSLIWWSKSGNGVNPNQIIERRLDPIAGGLALKDTVVRVEKIK